MGQERLQGTVSTPFTTVMICQLQMNEWRPKPPKLSLSWAWCQETSFVSLSDIYIKLRQRNLEEWLIPYACMRKRVIAT